MDSSMWSRFRSRVDTRAPHYFPGCATPCIFNIVADIMGRFLLLPSRRDARRPRALRPRASYDIHASIRACLTRNAFEACIDIGARPERSSPCRQSHAKA